MEEGHKVRVYVQSWEGVKPSSFQDYSELRLIP